MAYYTMHRDLLRLRREDPAFRELVHRGVDGAVLAENAFVLRYFVRGGADRLLVVNLGRDLTFDPAPEPLLAPPDECCWRLLWSSESTAYGGNGALQPVDENRWLIPGEAALVLAPSALKEKEGFVLEEG